VDKIKVLLVEDEMVLASVLKETLEPKGFSFAHASDGNTAWALFHSFQPDICVLDIMLPRKNGLELARDIRLVNEDVPIIFLTAKTATSDVLEGLKSGADDYLVKPFSIEELLLKIEVFLKRSQKKSIPEKERYTVGGFEFDADNYSLVKADKKTVLTQREAELLKLFLDNKNTVLKREQILTSLWGNDDYFMGRSLDVFISRLRKILSEEKEIGIENLHGIGFKFTVKE